MKPKIISFYWLFALQAVHEKYQAEKEMHQLLPWEYQIRKLNPSKKSVNFPAQPQNPLGSVEMLALLILNEDDAHGYRIVQEIKDRSDGRLIIKEGSLYPILYKLSDEGYIISQEDISETKLGRKRIRVIYSITPKGREHLVQLKEEYDIVHDSIRCIFERSKSL